MDSNRPTMPPPGSPLNAIHARIRRYNSDIDLGSDTYRAAVLLLAGLEWGHNIDVLSRRAGIDRSFVAKTVRRLIDNGVWVAGRTIAQWTALDEASGAFWNDVAVGEGKLCRRTLPDGTIEWAPAGFWNKSYHFVDPDVERSMNTVYFDPGERTAETVPLAAELVGSADDQAAPPQEVEAAEAETEPAVADATSGQPAGALPEPAADETQDEQEAEEKPAPPSLMEIFSDAVWIR